MSKFELAVLILAPAGVLFGQIAEKRTEREVVSEDLQTLLGGQVEFVLWDSTRVDLLTDSHAVEVDWAQNWAESIGQALYYAAVSGREPGIVLLVRGADTERFIYRCQTVCVARGIRLWVYDAHRRRMK